MTRIHNLMAVTVLHFLPSPGPALRSGPSRTRRPLGTTPHAVPGRVWSLRLRTGRWCAGGLETSLVCPPTLDPNVQGALARSCGKEAGTRPTPSSLARAGLGRPVRRVHRRPGKGLSQIGVGLSVE